MIQIKNVSIVHKKDMRELISDLSFVLNDGDKAVFIGEEGNGKSTLLKLIYDEALVADYVEYSGEIIRNNCILGYLPQELEQEEKVSCLEQRKLQDRWISDFSKEVANEALRKSLQKE